MRHRTAGVGLGWRTARGGLGRRAARPGVGGQSAAAGGSGVLFGPVGGDLGGAGLGVQTGQPLGMTRLQTATAGLGELGTDRTATGHTTAVLGQHRVQAAAPL
ncbi:hypothetical protein [Dactylosporangium sp. CA-233914]|uniref:hypothetical protein n=1 Tax=Dactylosporangium sp. CA-233914 TaxID=3239934 RepID=UPI003D90306D